MSDHIPDEEILRQMHAGLAKIKRDLPKMKAKLARNPPRRRPRKRRRSRAPAMGGGTTLFQHWQHDPARDTFSGAHASVNNLPSGRYDLTVDGGDKPHASKLILRDDELHMFKEGPMQSIMTELAQFWGSATHYKELGVTHKRGVLLHGPAGCGKTGIVAALIRDMIKREGLVLSAQGDLDRFQKAVPLLRQIEGPDRPLLILVEDLDNVCSYDEEELLEMLDGSSSMGDGILFLSTTNHLADIPVRVRCRPSRIDTLIEVPLPDKKQRHEYLKFICTNGFSRKDEDLYEWTQATEGFSLASLKELVLSIVIYRRSAEESIERLKGLSEQQDAPDPATP